jgi:predicted nucleic acid-binding protein
MRLYFDTSVLVASVLKAHVHHAAARAAFAEALEAQHRGYMAAHGLAEFYSVLTRMPTAPPVYPGEVWQMIEENILPHFTLVALGSREYRNTLSDSAALGWTGGRIYDALHLRAAQKAGCQCVYTFNVRHFRELAPPGLTAKIVSP